MFSMDLGFDPIMIKELKADYQEQLSMLKVECSLQIPSSWHINADSVTETFLIPTRLYLADSTRGELVKKDYPDPLVITLFGRDMSVFEGEISFKNFFFINKGVAFPIEAVLQYQSCDDKMCYPPKSRTIIIEKDDDNACTASLKKPEVKEKK
jgi:hypothetical protein